MKYPIALFLIIFVDHLALGQILKVDKASLDADSSGYFMGNINMDFNLNNRGATAEEQITFRGLTANADVVYVSEKHAYVLINTINYFKSTGGPLISTGYAHFRINLWRRKKMSYETFSQVQYDDGRNMPFRFLQGAGLRLNLKNGKKTNFHIGIGAMFEHEKWRALDEENAVLERNIWKTSNYLGGQFKINDFVRFNVICYYQGGYDRDSDIFRNRVSGDVVLRVKLTEKLAFLNSFTLQYEDRPIIPINNFLYSLTNGLQWNF